MKKNVEQAINEQINLELASAYVYLSMAAYFEQSDQPGSASWMQSQAQEEVGHAMRLFGYVNGRGGKVVLTAIAGPPTEFGSMLDVFKQALTHEQHVTATIHKLYELAVAEKDYATQSMLQWFINEQVEEEDTAGTIVSQLERIGNHPAALFAMDHQLGRRAAEH